MARKNTKEKMRNLLEKDSSSAFASMVVLPKHVSFESQNEDEDVFILLRQHWIVNVPWIFNLTLGIALPFVILAIISSLSIDEEFIEFKYLVAIWVGWYVTLSSYAFMQFLKWYFNAYIITNERILDLDFLGLLNHKISEASLENIEDVSSGHTGIWQNLFNFGTVKIQTAAETLEFRFDNVPKPGYVQDKIMDLAALLKKEK